MLYNQEQRQLMIWEQRSTSKAFKGSLLLLDLGFRIIRRRLDRKFNKPVHVAFAE